MGGNKVNAGPRATSAQIVQVAGAQQAGGEIAGDIIAMPVFTHRVAIFIIPLGPAWREPTYLIAARTDIPGFANQFQS